MVMRKKPLRKWPLVTVENKPKELRDRLMCLCGGCGHLTMTAGTTVYSVNCPRCNSDNCLLISMGRANILQDILTIVQDLKGSEV